MAVWDDINELGDFIQKLRDKNNGLFNKVVATSGGFDPLHVGHLRCIQASRFFGHILIVIVNGDEFLMRKKGYVFMPLKERLELVAGLAGVDHVVAWNDDSQFVDGAIEILKPNFFTKGGDRSTPECIAQQEHDACSKVGCEIKYAVGGKDKAQSSSKLAEKAKNANSKTRRTSGEVRQG